ncbi:MAG: PorP/SprF family type IX secretion system membrane protein [Cyclobacteriaceae bacterium]
MKLRGIKYVGMCVIFLGITLCSYGQQHIMYTQYMFNGLAINPAYAGSHEALSVTTLVREQWAGLKGAPSTQTLAAHSPIKNKHIGVGGVLVHDRIGVSHEYGFYGAYAYKIPMEKGTLSMGLQVGFTSYREDLNDLLLQTRPAPDFQDYKSAFMPNFGAGVFYSGERFYAGFSLPRMLQNSFDKENTTTVAKEIRHYFLTGGYVFDLNRNLRLKPNFLVKAVEGAPLQIDLNANLLIHDVVWLGLSHRSMADWAALLELQINQNFRLGYAYDFVNITELSKVQAGSHEIMLNYNFNKPQRKIKTPRFF